MVQRYGHHRVIDLDCKVDALKYFICFVEYLLSFIVKQNDSSHGFPRRFLLPHWRYENERYHEAE